MALESRIKLTADNFSPQSDLIEVFSKKAGVVGVINPSQIASPPSGGAGAIQFSDGSAFASDASNLFWDNTNKRLGVGTNAPTNTFEIASTTTAPFKVATTAGYFRSSYKAGASTGLFDFIDGPGFSFPLDNVQFGTSGALGAKVGIKGSGSTSATTSLLVQNSSGNQLLKVDDEGSVTIGNSSYNFSSPLLTLISNVGSFTMRVGGGSQLQCSANISATNLASNDYVQCIRVLVGNGTARLTATTTDWLSITDSAQTSNASGNLSAKFGTFGVTYASIDSSAQVEIASTTKGFLPPRMTTAQKNAIATPAIGLMVFDTTLGRPCFYNGAWVTL